MRSLAAKNAGDILREAYLERKARNGAYSTRAFARDLNMSQALVSLIMSGKRKVTLNRALKLAQLLELDDARAKIFLESVRRDALADNHSPEWLSSNSNQEIQELTLDRFKTIAQWHHIAILDLTTLKGFKSDIDWISKTLNIDSVSVRDALARLTRLGLLERKGNRWVKTDRHLLVTPKGSDEAVRAFHRQMIAKAEEQLQSAHPDDYARRSIRGATMAINSKRLEEAKAMIAKFERSLVQFLTEGDCDDLYQINFQFFPLTKRRSK